MACVRNSQTDSGVYPENCQKTHVNSRVVSRVTVIFFSHVNLVPPLTR